MERSPAIEIRIEDPGRPEITFWAAWQDGVLAGCAALKALGDAHGEIKSMKTAAQALRRGVASALLDHLLDEARRRGFRRLSLETGAADYFAPARRLYARFGFAECPAFPPYRADPSSVFMTRGL